MPLQTEFEFTLPKGYVDEEGTLHRTGVMRRATAADEILPLKDPRAQRNSAYLSILVLSRGHREARQPSFSYPQNDREPLRIRPGLPPRVLQQNQRSRLKNQSNMSKMQETIRNRNRQRELGRVRSIAGCLLFGLINNSCNEQDYSNNGQYYYSL